VLTSACSFSWGSTSSPLFKRKAMSSSAILAFQRLGRVIYEKWHSERTGIFSGSHKDDRDQHYIARFFL
jgi:hypothetical protein